MPASSVFMASLCANHCWTIPGCSRACVRSSTMCVSILHCAGKLIHWEWPSTSKPARRALPIRTLSKPRAVCGYRLKRSSAVEITQVAAIAIAAGTRVDDLAQIPLSFPTYAGILGRVAASAARQLNLKVIWQVHQAEMEKKESRVLLK